MQALKDAGMLLLLLLALATIRIHPGEPTRSAEADAPIGRPAQAEVAEPFDVFPATHVAPLADATKLSRQGERVVVVIEMEHEPATPDEAACSVESEALRLAHLERDAC